MSDIIETIKAKVTHKKQLHLAKAEVYPQLQSLVDASLEMRGVAMAAAITHGCSEEELWRWVISQVVD